MYRIATHIPTHPYHTIQFYRYGTHYIRSKTYGCEATALYTFSCTTQTSTRDISAALNANYNSGVYSVGTNVSAVYSFYATSKV